MSLRLSLILILVVLVGFFGCKSEEKKSSPAGNSTVDNAEGSVAEPPVRGTIKADIGDSFHSLFQRIQAAGIAGDRKAVRDCFLAESVQEKELAEMVVEIIIKEYALEDGIKAKFGTEESETFSNNLAEFPLPPRDEKWWTVYQAAEYDGKIFTAFPWLDNVSFVIAEKGENWYVDFVSNIPDTFIYMIKKGNQSLLFALEDSLEILKTDGVDADAILGNFVDCYYEEKPDLRPNDVPNKVEAPARPDQSSPEKLLEKINRAFVEKDEKSYLECVAGKDGYINLAKSTFTAQLASWEFYTAMKAAYGEDGWRKFVDEPGTDGMSGRINMIAQDREWWIEGTMVVNDSRAGFRSPEDYPAEFGQIEWMLLVKSGENWYLDLPSMEQNLEAVKDIAELMSAVTKGVKESAKEIGNEGITPADLSAKLGKAVMEALSGGDE